MLGQVVDEAADRFGDRIAYVEPSGETVSYAQLGVRTHQAARWLLTQGIVEGDVVAVVLPAGVDFVALYVGASRIGAITAAINPRLTPAERQALVGVSQAALVVGPREAGALRASDTAAVAHLDDDVDRPLAIIFTSGTTGIPKGAVFAARQLEAITTIDTGGRWDGGGDALAGTSFASLGPMTKLAGNLMRGGTTHLVTRWTARQALELTERHRVAGAAGIPTQIALMLRHRDFDRFDLSSVRAVVMGGGPATPTLVREARERFAAPVSIRYSCTEAGIGLGTALDAPPEDAELTVGRPHPGVTLTIVDDALEPVAEGEVGEVCLRSAATMSGYWNDPEATRNALTPDGSVRTGDVGLVDTEGRLQLVGRSKELYVRGGYNVFPAEVEAVLADHPDVVDVAVIPRPDEVMGEIGVAAVVPRSGRPAPLLDELRRFGATRLAHHKLPEDLAVLDDLPLTPADKVDRRALRQLLLHPDEAEER
jgi:acyl-CoA synthetase (AMP-forming)/AMP-acid ligase II